jgi:hypothetical protein
MTRLFVLLAHAICDSFGAEDVSGQCDEEDIVHGVTTLFSEILNSNCISWDTFFELVASTTAGVPCDSFHIGESGGEGCSSWAAIQHGSFVAVASWLDLAKEVQIRGSFGIVIAEGSILGILDDGFVRCEGDQLRDHKPTTFPSLQTDSQAKPQVDIEAASQIDTLPAEIFRAVFRTDPFKYRLMATVRVGDVIRIVDPSQVIMGLDRSLTI